MFWFKYWVTHCSCMLPPPPIASLIIAFCYFIVSAKINFLLKILTTAERTDLKKIDGGQLFLFLTAAEGTSLKGTS